MIARLGRFTILFVSVALAAACTNQAPIAKPPAPVTSFETAVDNAAKRVEALDYVGADRILSDFALAARGRPEAQEISFFRALYLVDPANKTASLSEGLKAIDIYLSTPGTTLYRSQAEVVKRTALAMQSLRAAQQTAKVTGRDTVFVTREDEVNSLKDQLAKANAELDRIKKRLANPSR